MPSKQYWTKHHEDLVIRYQNEPHNRNTIYNELRPALVVMMESIMKRFLGGFVRNNVDELVAECEAGCIPKVLLKFDPVQNTKAYSYVGTCIKHFYMDLFMPVKGNTKLHNDGFVQQRFDADGELVHDIAIEDTIDTTDLKDDVIESLNDKLRRARDSKAKLVLKHLLELVQMDNWGRLYATYFLMKKTGLKYLDLYRTLKHQNILGLTKEVRDIDYFNTLLKDIPEENIKDHLNWIEDQQRHLMTLGKKHRENIPYQKPF